MPYTPDFDDSTLWRVSAFERVRAQSASANFQRAEGPTLLPTTLLADLERLQADPTTDDVLETVAACVRHRESALLCLRYGEFAWPVTVFPAHHLYHSPRDIGEASAHGLAGVTLLSADPPGVRPPGHWMHERVADTSHYRPIGRLLWALALHGPRPTLLNEIGGRAAYRLVHSRLNEPIEAPGALGAAVHRLQQESVSLRDVSTWPGMSLERASRLLNALYLSGGLMVTRTHPAARAEPGRLRSWFRR